MHFHLLPKGKFGYRVPRDIPVSLASFFNRRLLNFNQYFASDADYILFARSVFEKDHLHSSTNFAMEELNVINIKGTIKRFVVQDNVFSFMSSVKAKPAQWKQFIYNVLAMTKQLGIPLYFLRFSCANLRW